jgi:hypothetical protein
MNYGFGEAFLEYFESWNFSCENTNIGVPMFMFDIRMINNQSHPFSLKVLFPNAVQE